MRPHFKSGFQLLLAALLATVNAHSWVEQLMVIAPNGTFVGSPGYARGNHLRTSPGFSDLTMTYLIPPNGRSNQSLILPTDKMCKETQRKQEQTDGSPRLQARPGAAIALRFQENGHVTLPENQPGKPKNRGTVYVYGTTEPREDENLLDVHNVWNKEGTGGDKRGVLLSVQNFDDGRCYQINKGSISENRQEKYPHMANQLMGADMWCQQDIALPSNAPPGKPYTLYWVWDWPTLPGDDPTLPNGKKEIYTTCIDVDVVDSPMTYTHLEAGYVQGQPLNKAAIPSQFAEIFGSASPTAASGSAGSSAAASTVVQSIKIQPVKPSTFVTVLKTVYVKECQLTPETSVTASSTTSVVSASSTIVSR